MNKHEQPIGVDPNIKKEINEEGFEGDAAVLIGKKEEMPNLEKILETEGRTTDLETYLRMHKEIIIPSETMSEEIKNMNLAQPFRKGDYLITQFYIYYMDSMNNLARVKIFPSKIGTLKDEKDGRAMTKKTERALVELGFGGRLGGPQTAGVEEMINGMIYRQENRIKEQNRQNAKNQFNF